MCERSPYIGLLENILSFWLGVKNVRSGSRVTRNRAELLWSGRELTTKMGEQPWSQLVCCASICCHVCGCVFQEDGIAVRSAGEEWYIN